MALYNPVEYGFANAVSKLTRCNPFLPDWVCLEQAALGDEYEPVDGNHRWLEEVRGEHPNLRRLDRRLERMLPAIRRRLADGRPANETELGLYESLVLYYLYRGCRPAFDELITGRASGDFGRCKSAWERFNTEFNRYLALPGRPLPGGHDPGHVFAIFFQLRRAFHHIFYYIIGSSRPTTELRAKAWESIFTYDLLRYLRTLYSRMRDFPTLITGASGTGKELVAQAIGLSQYIPFDEHNSRFEADFREGFCAVNLSAFSQPLIESEMFGHVKGAFTGAVGLRKGRLESCPVSGAVFLDEIGDLDAAVQVKLLRVLQTRTFQRIGDNADQRFEGKLITATSRNLVGEMDAGRFRRDLYYRLCADTIETPTLRQQLADSPDDLRESIVFICRQIVGDEAEGLAKEVENWIGRHLTDYPWPGNFRELEQCVRNVLVRKQYQPVAAGASADGDELDRVLSAAAVSGTLTAEQLLSAYCTCAYAVKGSYQEAAEAVGLNWRTVKAKMDVDRLQRLKPR